MSDDTVKVYRAPQGCGVARGNYVTQRGMDAIARGEIPLYCDIVPSPGRARRDDDTIRAWRAGRYEVVSLR
jgi:hypothetical protein